jgi:hypothetical protein
MTTPLKKVTVALLSDEDVSVSFQVVSKSFGNDAPFINMYFPDHDTTSGQTKGSKRFAEWKQASTTSTFLKAVVQVDGNENHIIGVAVWTYMKEAPPSELEKVENVEEVWPDEADREFMTRLWSEYVKPRTKAITDSRGQGLYGKWEPAVKN